VKIVKLAPGLDPGNQLGRVLGSGFEVHEFDPARPAIDQVRDADVLLLRDVPVPASLIDAAPRLKLLQRYGQHLVGVDIGYALKKGIHVARVPSNVSRADEAVAEQGFFLLMAVAKRLPLSLRSIAERRLGTPETVTLAGKTLGLVGVGSTGTALARMARGFGMRVTAVKRTIDRALERELGLAFLGTMTQLDAMLAEVDFVSIHLPLQPSTVGFFGRREFAMMKRGSCLVNIARAPIVDKAALHEALESGRLAGAGLDVFWDEPANPGDPLLQFPNVVLTPHVAGASPEIHERLAQTVAANIRAVERGETPQHLVLSEKDA
jgi:phosphoglycerate dehydrogenase-like enzyme